MTKRTRAATAAALPTDTLPDRRALLTSGAAAALIASTAAALPAADPDAVLLALREDWRRANSATNAAIGAIGQVERRLFARWPKMPTWETWPGSWQSFSDENARVASARLSIEVEEGRPEAEEARDEAVAVEYAFVERIAATPARTMAGLAFKIEVSADWNHDHEDIRDSIMADVAALAAAHPTVAL